MWKVLVLQKMCLLFWLVILLLSVSVTDVMSEPQVGTSGLRVCTIVPSPTDCRSLASCLTWSQCLSDTSQCFTSHTNVTMLRGEYILHEFLRMSGVVSLSIHGSGSEVNGSAVENQVVINCEYKEGGIGFMNVKDLSLSGITMVFCGVQGINNGFQDTEMGYLYLALQIVETVNVNLSFLSIINSTQIGLLCLNIRGTSAIQDSMFSHSNYRLLERYMQGKVECSEDNWECRGVNVWVIFFNPLINVASNVSNFVIERTKISHGVNLIPKVSSFSMSAGIAFHLNPALEYDVHITIDKCYLTNNIAPYAAHLSLGILSSCSVIVNNSTFTYANRLTESGPMELVTYMGTLKLSIFDDDYLDRGIAINVEIGIKQVHIAENVGGGLHISFFLHFSQSFFQLKVQKAEIIHNLLIQTTYQHFHTVIQFRGHLTNVGGVYISLESVDVSSNVVASQHENTGNPDVESIGMSAMGVAYTEVHFKQTTFSDNGMSALHSKNSDLHFHGVNVLRNNTGRHCGGALVLISSYIYLHKGTHVYIIENTALKYGGGICVDGGSVPESIEMCFWQVVDPDISDTFVYLHGNVAPITGYEIYAATVENCINLSTYKEQITSNKLSALSFAIFTHVFIIHNDVNDSSLSYQVSSQPLKICFCYQGPEPMCDASVVQQNVFPGQTFHVLSVGVGIGISPAVVKSRINGKYDISPKVQSLGNACEPLNYTILAPENISGILVQLTVEGSYLHSHYIKYLNLMTLECPQGFTLQQFKCECHRMLQRASVQCDINTQRFTRSGSVWIGMGSDDEGLLTHMHCPNAYCKIQQTDFNLTSPDVQCAFNHSGVLCGSCKPGLALMLGSSKCQYCSNIYLLLLLPFLAAGVLLVIILGRLDITVASGTMNGVLFYTNVVKASNDALISNSVSKYFMILSAWLNLDLGIETCFFSHLDMFWKVLLQFVFPLYIWLLVAAIILLSRYSTVAARLSGSNSVPVLATLFLFSYAKVLATIIVAFSFTSLEAEKVSPLVWLHDGNLRFLHGKHIALVVVSTLFALLYIIPLTLLLLFAPVLQRAHNHRIVRLIQRLKPLLDAFQGPYKNRFHWWPGLMLVIRIILFIALTANTTNDPRLSALFVGVTAFPLALFSFRGMYKNKLLNLHETAMHINMVVFILWSLFNYSACTSKTEFTKQQQATAYTMISVFYFLFMAVLIYHIRKKLTDLGVPHYLFNLCRRRGELANDNGELEGRDRQGSGYAPVSAQPPTVTFVELREPLLTDRIH